MTLLKATGKDLVEDEAPSAPNSTPPQTKDQTFGRSKPSDIQSYDYDTEKMAVHFQATADEQLYAH